MIRIDFIFVRLQLQWSSINDARAFRTLLIFSHPTCSVKHRRALFAVNGSIVERKQNFYVAANLAQIPSARAQFTFPYVQLKYGKQFVEEFDERSVLDRNQIGNTVHINALHHVTLRSDGIFQQFWCDRYTAFGQIASHIIQICAQFLHQTQVLHVNEEFGIFRLQIDYRTFVQQG